MSLSDSLRYNQKFYSEFLITCFYDFFKLPTKNNYGHGLDHDNKLIINISKIKNKTLQLLSTKLPFVKNPYINYVDFNKKLRKDLKFKNLVLELLLSFERRSIINSRSIWNMHFKSNVDHSKEILAIASLEVILQSKNR